MKSGLIIFLSVLVCVACNNDSEESDPNLERRSIENQLLEDSELNISKKGRGDLFRRAPEWVSKRMYPEAQLQASDEIEDEKPKIDLHKIKSSYDEISELYKGDKRNFTSNLLDKRKIKVIKHF